MRAVGAPSRCCAGAAGRRTRREWQQRGRCSRKQCRHDVQCSDHNLTLNNCGSRRGSGAGWPSLGCRCLRWQGTAFLLL